MNGIVHKFRSFAGLLVFGFLVSNVVVAKGPLPQTFPQDAPHLAVGFTEPFQSIELAASETGTLAVLDVKRGQLVQADQVLGSLDNEVLQANLTIAKTKLESDSRLKAALIRQDRAEQNYKKLKQALEEGFGGKRELELASSDLELAITDVQAVKDERQISRLDLTRIEAELRRRTLVSPINGIITKVNREIGEFVSATDPVVLTIVDLNRLRIRFYPQTAAAEKFEAGGSVEVKLAHTGQAVMGIIEFVAPVIDADSDTVQVDVLLDNREGKIRSGRRCHLIGPSGSRPVIRSASRNDSTGLQGARR